MYKRILVPTDGSERSVKAVEGAARFARPLGATLVVMTVVEPYSYTNLAEYRYTHRLRFTHDAMKRAMAVGLAEEGAKVLAVDRDAARVEETLERAGDMRASIVPWIVALKAEVGTLLHCASAYAVISLARAMVMNGVTPSKS